MLPALEPFKVSKRKPVSSNLGGCWMMALILGMPENSFSYPPCAEGRRDTHAAGVGCAAMSASLHPHTLPLAEGSRGGAEQSRGGDGFSESTWYLSCRDSAEFPGFSPHSSAAFHTEARSTQEACTCLHLWVSVYFRPRGVFIRPAAVWIYQ